MKLSEEYAIETLEMEIKNLDKALSSLNGYIPMAKWELEKATKRFDFLHNEIKEALDKKLCLQAAIDALKEVEL